MPQHPAAILSADLLVHGSLLGSRVPLGTINDEEKVFDFRKQTACSQPTNRYGAFFPSFQDCWSAISLYRTAGINGI